ncbi:hypothetical protein F5B17DRAFT_412883 [Nemania serpens]|nr:hypothetical protein F5B17DRAFT_412883 [Nemania serpens]
MLNSLAYTASSALAACWCRCSWSACFALNMWWAKTSMIFLLCQNTTPIPRMKNRMMRAITTFAATDMLSRRVCVYSVLYMYAVVGAGIEVEVGWYGCVQCRCFVRIR